MNELMRKFLTTCVVIEEQAREDIKDEFTQFLTREVYRAVRDVLRAENVQCDVARVSAAVTLRLKRMMEGME